MKHLHYAVDLPLATGETVDDEMLEDGDLIDAMCLPVLRARDKRLFVELEKRVGDDTILYPVLPDTTVEVLRLIDDQEASMESIELALDEDARLSKEVLRNANSVWFGARITVEDTHSALMRLGKKNLRNILLGVSLKLSLVQGPGAITSLGEGLWRHSMASGAVARLMATVLAGDRDHWFLAGLMHDLGQVALLATVNEIIQTTMRGYSPRGHILRPILRWHHQSVGRVAAGHWMLPEDLVASVAHHHRPQRAGIYGRLAAVTNVTNLITHALQESDQEEAADEESEDQGPLSDPELIMNSPGGKLLNLSESITQQIVTESKQFFDGAVDTEEE